METDKLISEKSQMLNQKFHVWLLTQSTGLPGFNSKPLICCLSSVVKSLGASNNMGRRL